MKPFERKYTDEQFDTFHAALDKGMTIRKAAELAGIKRSTASKYASDYHRRNGKPNRRPKAKAKAKPKRKRAKSKATTPQPKPAPRVAVESSPITSADVDAIRFVLDEILSTQRAILAHVCENDNNAQLAVSTAILETLQQGIRLAPANLPAQPPSLNGKPKGINLPHTAKAKRERERHKKVNTDNVKLSFFTEDPDDMVLTPALRKLIPEAAECVASGYKNDEIITELSPDITTEQLKFLKTTDEFKTALAEVRNL